MDGRLLAAAGFRALPLTARALHVGNDEFNPLYLFGAGEQGIWIDPSDFSTLYQDSAGTTPVTAVGQPVGLALDKRLGLVLGSELIANGGFSGGVTTGWTANNATLSVSGGELVIDAASTTQPCAYQALTVTANQSYRLTAKYRSDVANAIAKSARLRVGSENSGGTIFTGPHEVTANGVYIELTTVFTPTVSTVYVLLEVGSAAAYGSAGDKAYFDNVSVKSLAGNHAYQTTAASRPTLQQDSNGLYYLSFDGTDDSMATPSINFTGTDKMTVWAGVRKLSDAAAGIVCELSASVSANNGSFYLAAPASPNPHFNFSSRGSTQVTVTASPFAAPITSVLNTVGDISGDIASIAINGVTVQTSSVDQGTGTYGNYPLYIGRRNNASLPFNGRIYQLIVRGAASNAGQIAATEAYVNAKTRAF